MLIKICGMRDSENIRQILNLMPDFVGMIFYPRSPRYMAANPDDFVKSDFSPVKKTGVFVNETVERILEIANDYHLSAIQLHGDESPEICMKIKSENKLLIKAFGISSSCDFAKCTSYEGVCDYFLFDTKTEDYGGSGRKFDWSALNSYQLKTPFILSGGISEADAADILSIKHPKMAGVDLNSRFESSPALKDVHRLKNMIDLLR